MQANHTHAHSHHHGHDHRRHPKSTDPVNEVHPRANKKIQAVVGRTTAKQALPAIVSHIFKRPPEPTWKVSLSIATRVSRAGIATANERFEKTKPQDHDELIEQVRECRFIDPASSCTTDEIRGGTVLFRNIRVKKRPQDGILKEAAERETGDRILRARRVVLLHLHGGAHVVQDLESYRNYNANVSMMSRCRVYAIDYRLAPEAVFPDSLLDAMNAYYYLTEDLGVPPSDIILSGDSAGGTIAVQLMMYLRDHGFAQVGGAILLSPWLDLSTSFNSWEENENKDFLTIGKTNEALHPPRLYVSDAWPPDADSMLRFQEMVVHPYVSPALAPAEQLRSFPPILIHSGGCERLRDDATVFTRRARLADENNMVGHQLWVDGVHVFASVQETRAGASAQKEVGKWLQTMCDRRPATGSPEATWAKEIDAEVTRERRGRISRAGKIPPFPKASRKWRYEGKLEQLPDIGVKPDGYKPAFAAAAEANSAEGMNGVTEVFRPYKMGRQERHQRDKEMREMQNKSSGNPYRDEQ
ncbi:hypothetical protein JCM8202v2_001821 [Rhodotorula sphaerocarpa]